MRERILGQCFLIRSMRAFAVWFEAYHGFMDVHRCNVGLFLINFDLTLVIRVTSRMPMFMVCCIANSSHQFFTFIYVGGSH